MLAGFVITVWTSSTSEMIAHVKMIAMARISQSLGFCISLLLRFSISRFDCFNKLCRTHLYLQLLIISSINAEENDAQRGHDEDEGSDKEPPLVNHKAKASCPIDKTYEITPLTLRPS